jgi:putative peptidoglycan lipid II flippase
MVFTGGRFSAADAGQCAAYFSVFSVSMFLWSAQAIYSRAFFAAGNTVVPMAAGTIVTVISLPIYVGLFHGFGAMGLAVASDIGIAMQTVAIGGMLHRRKMVSLASLDYRELRRCLIAALAAGVATWIVFSWLAGMVAGAFGMHLTAHSRWSDLVVLLAGGLMWGGICFWILKKTGSALPRVFMKRLRLA